MSLFRRITCAALLCASLGLIPTRAQANPHYRDHMKNHPRRDEVNRRLDRQNRRENQGLKSGKLSQGQYNKVQAEDRAIHRQEVRDARAHGGHITKQEQRHLNREENAVNREIKRDEKQNAPK